MTGPGVCRACGKPMLFALNPKTGNTIPLDARPVVYRATKNAETGEIEVTQTQEENLFVSHFSTCPEARNFTKRKKS